jgi:ADP-heptose:LPS heptosyltransferase
LQRESTSTLSRILVIKPDHLGDLLLATPALHALRCGLPRAHIVGLVGPWAAQIWRANPDLNALLELPFPGFERAPVRAVRNTPLRRLRPYHTLFRYAVLLRAMRFDAALLFRDDHWWGAWLAWLAGIPVRIGHAHPRVAPTLTHTLPYNPREHVARQNLAIVNALTGTTLDLPPPLRYTPPPVDRVWAEQWRATHLPAGGQLAVIHPGTGGSTKHWLPQRWAAVADALAERPGWLVLLTGGPGEAELVQSIAGAMRQPVQSLVGQTSPGQLTALLAHAAIVLGVDSGPLHLAVSQGVPTVHLYGPSDQQRFGPWGNPARHVVLRAGVPCSPCGVFNACPLGYAPPICMEQISVEMVLHELMPDV